MNVKLAKRLRREANYHPSQPRTYTTVNRTRKGFLKGTDYGTVELVDSDPRVLYKELKKEIKNGY